MTEHNINKNTFSYQNNELYIEEIKLSDIAKDFGTPCYVYSASRIEEKFNTIETALTNKLSRKPLVAFACKSNSNLSVLKLIASLGGGSDIVSLGELKRCIAAGIPADKIVYSGVGKNDEEIRESIKLEIRQLNVESENELLKISKIAKELGKTANVTLRVNPDLKADTHRRISTGTKDVKFGIAYDEIERLYKEAHQNPALNIRGLHVHTGSGILDVEHFRASYSKIAVLAEKLISQGLPMDTIDLGGGLGIIYNESSDVAPNLEHYADIVAETVGKFGVDIVIEPGKFIAGDCGVIISSVVNFKHTAGKSFIILDAGMNDLIRPAIYDAWHEIKPLELHKERKVLKYDVVGPVCETSDIFGSGRELQEMEEGDLVGIMSSGAYGMTMASNYNTRTFAPEIMVKGDKVAQIRKRQNLDELIALDSIPEWL